MAIINSSNGKDEFFNGNTLDISIGGASILSGDNIFIEGVVTMFIRVPPYVASKKESTIEVQCRMTSTVLTSDHHHFRIGLQFVSFKGNGQDLLAADLSHRTPLL